MSRVVELILLLNIQPTEPSQCFGDLVFQLSTSQRLLTWTLTHCGAVNCPVKKVTLSSSQCTSENLGEISSQLYTLRLFQLPLVLCTSYQRDHGTGEKERVQQCVAKEEQFVHQCIVSENSIHIRTRQPMFSDRLWPNYAKKYFVMSHL